ncbi:porin, partial [Paraburkholderia sp. UCT2]|nr:porin [Paraburkholderia sp. UCT2]
MVSSLAVYPIDVFEEELILRHAMACLLNTVREALTISVGVRAAWGGGALLLYAHGA